MGESSARTRSRSAPSGRRPIIISGRVSRRCAANPGICASGSQTSVKSMKRTPSGITPMIVAGMAPFTDDLAPQHVAAGRVTALPDVARNDGHGFGAGTIVGRREVATERGLDAEHGERVGRHIQPVELLGGGAVAPQADGADRKGGRRAVEYPRVAAPILVVGKREAGLSAARIDRPHNRDAVRALEREVAPQDGVRADEGRVRHAHREREREDGAGGEPPIPGEDSPRESPSAAKSATCLSGSSAMHTEPPNGGTTKTRNTRSCFVISCLRGYPGVASGSSSFCTLKLPTSPTYSVFSLRQSIALTVPNSFSSLPARPNLPIIVPSRRIL